MAAKSPKKAPSGQSSRIRTSDIAQAAEAGFLTYSMSVITSRALPDARDGLKPVQRRILVAMDGLGLGPGRARQKSATVVGEVLGKYHPHGDSSVYDAMVRLSQDFTLAAPLVDGQGNWGNIDGNSAAAYRYTEARLTAAAAALLVDMERDTVDFRPNYNDQIQEPVVLPARFPNLLLNGGEGIAVGMATKIPPHNLGELAQAVAAICDDPASADSVVLKSIKGPDFPTGGVLFQDAELRQYLATGRGKLTLRGVVGIESRGPGRNTIVISSFPYGVGPSDWIREFAAMVNAGSKDTKNAIPWGAWIDDARDESDRDGLRVTVDLKRDVDPALVINALHQRTKLETSYSPIIVALVHGEPRTLSLRECLDVFVAHRLDVVVRRARYNKAEAERRAHVLEGHVIAISNIAAVVELIRKAADQETAGTKLRSIYKLTKIQSDAVLALRLARLTALDVKALKAELVDLHEVIQRLNAYLASPALQRQGIKEEVMADAELFGKPRRTKLVSAKAIEASTVAPIVMAATTPWIVSRDTLGRLHLGRQAPSRGLALESAVLESDGSLVAITDTGKAYPVEAENWPDTARDGWTDASVMLQGAGARERVVALVSPERGGSVLTVLSTGMVKRTAASEYAHLRRGGTVGTVLQEQDGLVSVMVVMDEDEVLLATRTGKAIRFAASTIPLQGRASRGVWGIRPAEGDSVSGAVRLGEGVAVVTANGYGKRVDAKLIPSQNRGGQGVWFLRATPKTGEVAGIASSPGSMTVVPEKGRAHEVESTVLPSQAREHVPGRIKDLGEEAILTILQVNT